MKEGPTVKVYLYREIPAEEGPWKDLLGRVLAWALAAFIFLGAASWVRIIGNVAEFHTDAVSPDISTPFSRSFRTRI